MPPVKTVPPETTTKHNSSTQQQLYTLVVHTNFVQVPVTVKDRRRAHGGRTTLHRLQREGSNVQKLSFFTADPFAPLVAIVLDLGMSDTAVQRPNETFPVRSGCLTYDEVALYNDTVERSQRLCGGDAKIDRAVESDEDGARLQ